MTDLRRLDSILEGIGRTPLLRLRRSLPDPDVELFAKLEFLNPMGSIKDRLARYMVEKAEREGRLKPGDTIVDNSSGNTALGLAMVGALKGYKVKMVVRDNLSPEKLKFLKALDVEVVMVDHTLPPEDPGSYNRITPRIAHETARGYYLDQHNNRDNNECHYRTTGPEIWEQMEGRIDVFVAGVGTGGTICGSARFLKEKDPGIRVIGVDPVGSIFYDYFHSRRIVRPAPYRLEGLGDEFLIGCVDFDVLDDIVRVTDRDAFAEARALVRTEGLLAGGSSGAAVWAARRLAAELPRPSERPLRMVTVLSDSANRYLSTIFNDDWLHSEGLID